MNGTYVFYEDGKEIYRSKNIITKFGKRYMTNLIAGKVPNFSKLMALGIGDTAATINDTRLEFEFYRVPVTLYSTDIQTLESNSQYSVVYKSTIPQEVAGVISEVGIYPAGQSTINYYDSKFLSQFDSSLSWTSLANGNPELSIQDGKISDNLLIFKSFGTEQSEYLSPEISLDLSGYSVNDTLCFAYYQYDLNLNNIKIRLYSDDTNYFEAIIPGSTIGYHIVDNISLASVLANGTPDASKSLISKIGIVISPIAGQSTSIGADGLRINDEDTFDPDNGIISRSVLPQPLVKVLGRSVDIEYRLDLNL